MAGIFLAPETDGVRLSAVHQETRNKLHPALLLSAEALHAVREKSRQKNSPVESLWGDLINALNNVKTKFLDVESPTQESLVKNEMQAGKAISMLTKNADPHPIFRTSNPLTAPRTHIDFVEALHLNAPQKAQIITSRAKRALKSIRANRNPLPAHRKICHDFLLLLLSQFGALRHIASCVYDPHPLTFVNLTDFFDYVCPTCRAHTPEALRKMVRVYGDSLKSFANTRS